MAAKPLKKIQTENYLSFEQLDGTHPWMTLLPDGCVSYKVRELQKGHIAYFNFALAKEMGLISITHPHHMNNELEQKLIKTFSIQIINEYDEISEKKFSPETIKKNRYMASRYLQSQHSNKQGKTSGDGRGIWNGTIENRGKIWDVSSRGTGVTKLAPGAVEANKPLKTGGDEYGYGCGLAEIDELYGAAILAELMYLQGIPTERVLCIIDLGKGYGIGVRAAQNLIRPAHFFIYLKQNRYDELKKAIDYFIQRQFHNGKKNLNPRSANKYDELVESISKNFAEFTAKLDIDYIFAWLDWDGDNVLADAGVIDYGSVRQFGTRHDQYRYDDIERFSTNLNEQRLKARLIVQVFAQIVDYIKTKKKKPLKDFSKHPTVVKFNENFSHFRSDRLLYRMGFNQVQRDLILKNKSLFDSFDKEFSYFERAKISGTIKKVSDGVNHPALFNMRYIFKKLPLYFKEQKLNDTLMPEDQFYKTILSSFAKSNDTKIRSKHINHIKNFQMIYKEMIRVASGKQDQNRILNGIIERSNQLNREDRITGNALIQIVNELIAEQKKGMTFSDLQKMIDQIIYSHLSYPEIDYAKFYDKRPRPIHRPDLFSKIIDLVEQYKDDI